MVHNFKGRAPTGGELWEFLFAHHKLYGGIRDTPVVTGCRLSMTEDSPASIEVCEDHIFIAYPPEPKLDWDFDEEYHSE